MINQDRPAPANPAKLSIGGGFSLLIGGIYNLLVGAAGTGGLTNSSKVSVGETWGTASSTWAAETRTWLAASQLITNTTLSLTDPLWSYRTFPWTLTAPWGATSTGITNQAKP